MNGPGDFDAARAPRRPPKAARRDGRRHAVEANEIERELAELEALLTRDLQRAPTPRADAEPPRVRPGTGDTGTLRPPRRTHAQAAPDFHDPDHQEYFDWPAHEPESELPHWAHRLDGGTPRGTVRDPDRPSLLTRVVAPVVGMIALFGVSALVAVLIVGGEPPAPATTEHAAPDVVQTDEATLAATNTRNEERVPQGASEPIDPLAETGRTGATVLEADTTGTALRPSADRAVEMAPADTETADRLAGTLHPSESWPAQSAFTVRAPEADAARPLHTPDPGAGVGGPFQPATFEAQDSRFDSAPPADAFAPADTAAVDTDDIETDHTEIEPVDEDAGALAQPTRSAAVTTAVNMRAGPDNGAAVVAVVPAGRNVDVVRCDLWCEVVYDGQRGFIFQRFVQGAGQ